MTEIKNKNLAGSHYDSMMIALCPLIICACFLYTRRVLLICAVAMLTARGIDVAVSTLRRGTVDAGDKSSPVAALTFALMLPVSIPLYIVVVSLAVAILAGKHAFGGKEYPFNLSALAMCVAAVNWPEQVFRAVKPFSQVNFWTGAGRVTITGSSRIKSGGLPYTSLFNLLLGNHASAMGTSFILIIVAVGIYLISTGRITWHIPAAFILTCSVWALLFPRIYGVGRLFNLKFELLSSAVFYYAVFILSEPATTPKHPKAKLFFGFLCGVGTMFFRYYGSYEIGGCFAILLVNATQGFWDRLFSGRTKIQQLLPARAQRFVREKFKRPAKAAVTAAPAQKPAQKPAPKDEAFKAAAKDAPKGKAPKNKAKTPPKDRVKDTTKVMDIIARAEDHLDEVEFSTRSIDVSKALADFEKRHGKEDK